MTRGPMEMWIRELANEGRPLEMAKNVQAGLRCRYTIR